MTGLDASGVADYLVAAVGHDLDADGLALAETVWRETDGNCFFVAEVFRHLAETGAVEERDGRWSTTAAAASVPIPAGVRDVIARRLSRLPEPAGRVLGAAAVAGLEFDPAVVEAAGGFTEEEVLTALEAAAASRLVVETHTPGAVPRNRFSHALVRSTLYDNLTAARRRSLHRHTAEAIEMIQLDHLDDHLPALAHHWAQSGAHADKAIDYAIRAGDRALAQLAFDEAAAFFANALALLRHDDPRRVELLISLGDAQRRAADPAHRETLLEAARLAQGRGDPDALARAALANSRTAYWSTAGDVDEERVETLEAALARSATLPAPIRSRLLATLGVELVYTPKAGRRQALSDEALALARRSGDASSLAHALLARFYTIYSPLTVAERLANTGELLDLADRLRDPVLAFLGSWQRARAALDAGDLVMAAASLERAESLVPELGQPTFRWMTMWTRVGQVLVAGRIDEADQLIHETHALGVATGQPDAGTFLGVQLVLLRYEQSRLHELESLMTEFQSRYPAVPGITVFLALVLSETSRPEEARRVLAPLAERGFELPFDVTWLAFTTVAAEVVRSLGDAEWADTLYRLLQPHAAIFAVIGGLSTGCTSYYLGLLATMLGRFAEADQHFTFAAAVYDRIGAPAHLGRTRIEWARMRLTRRGPGDVEEAKYLLDQALVAAMELGLVNVERRARAVLEAML